VQTAVFSGFIACGSTESAEVKAVARSLLCNDAIATRDRNALGGSPGHTLSKQGQEFFDMLVLSRKVGERIHVGDNVVLEIRRIAGNRVTLALDAPRHVRILRGELQTAAGEFSPPPPEDRSSPLSVPARAPLLDHGPVAPACREYVS
jgi:carbon storage regulator CsrA